MAQRTTISWSQEDTILLLDLSRHKGKAIGSRIKRLAMAGLMLERLGITMDGNGAIRGLAEKLMTESSRGDLDNTAPPSPDPAVASMFADKAHEQDFNDLMKNMGL